LFIWFVSFVWLNQTDQIDQMNQINLRVSPVSPVSRGNPAGAKRPYTISINNSINAYESPLIRLDADDDELFICQLAGEMVQFGKLP